MLPREFDKPSCPVIVIQIAQMGVAGQQVLVDDAIVPAVNAAAAPHLVGEYRVRRQVFHAGIMEFMRKDYRLIFTFPPSPGD